MPIDKTLVNGKSPLVTLIESKLKTKEKLRHVFTKLNHPSIHFLLLISIRVMETASKTAAFFTLKKSL